MSPTVSTDKHIIASVRKTPHCSVLLVLSIRVILTLKMSNIFMYFAINYRNLVKHFFVFVL